MTGYPQSPIAVSVDDDQVRYDIFLAEHTDPLADLEEPDFCREYDELNDGSQPEMFGMSIIDGVRATWPINKDLDKRARGNLRACVLVEPSAFTRLAREDQRTNCRQRTLNADLIDQEAWCLLTKRQLHPLTEFARQAAYNVLTGRNQTRPGIRPEIRFDRSPIRDVIVDLSPDSNGDAIERWAQSANEAAGAPHISDDADPVITIPIVRPVAVWPNIDTNAVLAQLFFSIASVSVDFMQPRFTRPDERYVAVGDIDVAKTLRVSRKDVARLATDPDSPVTLYHGEPIALRRRELPAPEERFSKALPSACIEESHASGNSDWRSEEERRFDRETDAFLRQHGLTANLRPLPGGQFSPQPA